MITPKQAHAMTGFHSRKRTPEFEAEMESLAPVEPVLSKVSRKEDACAV